MARVDNFSAPMAPSDRQAEGPPFTLGQTAGSTLSIAKMADGPTRILIVALNYAPDMVGCAKYTTELAEDLVVRGHRVEVVTAPPYYPQWKIADGYDGGRWSREERAGIVVHRTPLYVPDPPAGFKRLLHSII